MEHTRWSEETYEKLVEGRKDIPFARITYHNPDVARMAMPTPVAVLNPCPGVVIGFRGP